MAVPAPLVEAPLPAPLPALPVPPTPWRWEISAAFMGTLGLQPKVGLGFAPSALLEIPDLFGILIEGGFAAPTSETLATGQGVKSSFFHGSLALVAPGYHGDRFTVLGYGGWLLGGLVSRGEGFDQDGSGTPLVHGPWLGGRVTVRLVGPVGLGASLGLVVPIARAELYYVEPSGERTLYETSPVAGLAGLSLAIRQP